MSAENPEAQVPVRSRTIAHLHLDDEGNEAVVIQHIYEPDGAYTCDCGSPCHDPGMVALSVSSGEAHASVLLTAGHALMIANRLQRAASLIMESDEDVPDVEREAAKFSVVPDSPPED